MPFNPIPIQKRLRGLHRAGLISHAAFAVGDALLWSARAPGSDRAQLSYERIADLAGVARSTVKPAIDALRRLGVLNWRGTRIRVLWRSLVGRNIYRFTASDGPPANPQQARKTRSASGIEGMARRLRAIQEPRRSVAEQLRELSVPAVGVSGAMAA